MFLAREEKVVSKSLGCCWFFGTVAQFQKVIFGFLLVVWDLSCFFNLFSIEHQILVFLLSVPLHSMLAPSASSVAVMLTPTLSHLLNLLN